MFAQLQAGMRGLQLVYNGVSRLLVDLPDNPESGAVPQGLGARSRRVQGRPRPRRA